MVKMRKNIKITTVLFLIVIILVTLITLGIGLYSLHQKPPIQEITYNEFPFRLEYKIDGEHFIIEDAYEILAEHGIKLISWEYTTSTGNFEFS